MKFSNKQIQEASQYVYEKLEDYVSNIYYFEDLQNENLLLRFDSNVKKYLYDYYNDKEYFLNVDFETFYNDMSEEIANQCDYYDIVISLQKNKYLN